MITKEMIDRMDKEAEEERKEILKVAEEAGISFEEVVEMENRATYNTAKWLIQMDRMGLLHEEDANEKDENHDENCIRRFNLVKRQRKVKCFVRR